MNIIKTLNHFWRKPESKPMTESVDLSKLQDNYVLNVGVMHCDLCKKETANCYKIDIAGQCVCLAPRKDIRGLRKPKDE